MITNRVVTELQRIKIHIEEWFIGRDASPDGDAAKSYRKAEELIWNLQERYGYIPDRQKPDQ